MEGHYENLEYEPELRKFRSTVGRIVMALVFASMIGGISIAPAFGRDEHRREGYHERGRYEHDRRAYYPPPPLLPGACLCASTGCLCPGPVSVAGHQPRLPHPYSIGDFGENFGFLILD